MSQPIPMKAKYRNGVSKRCSADAIRSIAAEAAAATAPPRNDVMAVTTPTARLSNSGAKSPEMGVDVANSKMAVPVVHAAPIARPSMVEMLKMKNSSHGVKATTIAARHTGQSEMGR